ncbi:hypothetical protein WJX73_000097 [Symbiochloris irregularis]|uniref:F-box domain-containing protein n=1 Tax=Symbiochloris irregularis TaxID=706552 RepID=A0AAW1NRD0_9CHLO
MITLTLATNTLAKVLCGSMVSRKRQLLSLPDGVLYLVLDLLDFRSKVCCELVSRQLYSLLNRPGLWPRIEVTLQQLLGSDDSRAGSLTRTSAARWILARVEARGSATHIHLQGAADCIMKGFKVASFFTLLEERSILYSMSAELSGFPLSCYLAGCADGEG